MKNKVIKEKQLSMIKTCLLFFLVYGIMLVKHYSSDSYYYFMNPIENSKRNLSTGKIGSFLADKIIHTFHLDYISYQSLFVLLLIAIMAICVEVLYNHYLNISYKTLRNSQLLLLKLALILMFCNIFVFEWYIYVETVLPWSLSLLFMLLAVLQIKPRFGIRHVIICIMLLTIALNFYHISLGLFATFALFSVYFANNGELHKKSVIDSLKVFFCCAISSLINVLILGILPILHVEGSVNPISGVSLTDNFGQIVWNIKEWFTNSYGFFPAKSILVGVLLVYVALIIWMIKFRTDAKKSIYIFFLIILGNFAVYVPHLFAKTVWMPQRTLAGFFAVIFIPVAIIAFEEENKISSRLCYISVCALLLINGWKIQQIGANVIVNNRIDEEMAYLINNKIQAYEAESGIEVKKIAVANDAVPTWGYRAVDFVSLDTNLRVYEIGWGAVACINYYNGRNYQTEIMSEEQRNLYFENRNWDYLELDEQMAFDDDTLYFISY